MSLLRSPARIIKGTSPLDNSDAFPLQYTDLRQQCNELVANARSQAEQLLNSAHAEVAALRAQAAADGFASGCESAREAMEAEVETRARQLADDAARRRLGPMMTSIEQLLRQLNAEREDWVARSETQVVRLAARMAERIVRTEIAARPQLAEGMLREALSLAAGLAQVRVRVHPEDAPLVQSSAASQAAASGCQVVADSAICRGGCVVELSSGSIDARVETQLARMVDELTGD